MRIGENGEDFVDHYDILQVDPLCDFRTLEAAFHSLAKTFHPDNSETAEPEKFARVLEAYRTLQAPETRAAYDRTYDAAIGLPSQVSPASTVSQAELGGAADDADKHRKILMRLYSKRRSSPSEPGIGDWLLREWLDCSDDELAFHLWYLRSKGLIAPTENGTIAITVEGVDHVLATSLIERSEKLLIAHQSGPDGESD